MEQVLMQFNSARIRFWKWYLAAAVMVLAWVGVSLTIPGIPVPEVLSSYAFILPIVAIAFIIIAEIRVRSKKYIITDNRLIERNGIFSKEETFLASDRIANYTVRQNFAERLMGIGNVEIESIDGDEAAEITMDEVAGVGKIKELLDKLVAGTRYGARKN